LEKGDEILRSLHLKAPVCYLVVQTATVQNFAKLPILLLDQAGWVDPLCLVVGDRCHHALPQLLLQELLIGW
jgi:hypothetical protein